MIDMRYIKIFASFLFLLSFIPFNSLHAIELKRLWLSHSQPIMVYQNFGIAVDSTIGISDSSSFQIIDLDTGNIIRTNCDLTETLRKSYSSFITQIDDTVIIPGDSLKCFDFATGKLKWENKSLDNCGKSVKGDGNNIYTTQYKSIQSNILDIVSIDINTGLVQSHISVNVPDKQYDEYEKPVLIDCVKEYIFVRINCCEIMCIDMKEKKMLWRKTMDCKRFMQPGEEHKIINDFYIGYKTVYDCRSDPYIYCLDVKIGKELWQVLGTFFASIDDTYLYYYQAYVRDCIKDKQKYIGKIELSTGKIIDRYIIDEDKILTSYPYHNRYIFHTYEQSNVDGLKTGVCKIMDFDFNTLVVIENKLENGDNSGINVYGNYLFMYIESRDHLLKCICYSLPDYNLPKENRSQPTNILLWLLNLIFRKIYALP